MKGVTLEQLADYIAFVALAQVDPEADLSRFESILNLFQPGGLDTTGLSPWDRAYLDGLYDMQTGFVGRGAQTRGPDAAPARGRRPPRANTRSARRGRLKPPR